MSRMYDVYDVELEDDRGNRAQVIGYGNTHRTAKRHAIAQAARKMPNRSWRVVSMTFRREEPA